ncbi:IclR family transcriptional regulator C-terminal domain-containing protein [Vibrio sp. M60_M31a]
MGRVPLSGLPEEELDHLLPQSNLIQIDTKHADIALQDELKAEIAAVRVQGYAINDQELETGTTFRGSSRIQPRRKASVNPECKLSLQ